MKRPVLGWLVAGLAAAVGAAWFFTNFERVTETIPVGFHGEARRNPFLAAERLYMRLGAHVGDLHALSTLRRLPHGAVLLVAAPHGALGPRELDALLAWVRSGGRLIVEAERPSLPDALLERLRVQRTQRRGARVTLVPLAGYDKPLHALGLGAFSLAPPDADVLWRIDSEAGTRLAALRHGAGSVLVATSLDFMRNALIGELDHAELAWALAGRGAAHEILVLGPLEAPSLLEWLRVNAWQALAGAGACATTCVPRGVYTGRMAIARGCSTRRARLASRASRARTPRLQRSAPQPAPRDSRNSTACPRMPWRAP